MNFAYLEEPENSFLALFPHRFDFIWAEHGDLGQTVNWQTESRYPLSDRLILQGAYLYGVRFGSETCYALLDIDRDSLYHPKQDPLAVGRLIAALEPLGLVSYVACTSSYSGGLHLYLPFAQPQNSWKLAIALAALLEAAGFRLRPGQLEVFPNPKPYVVNGTPTLFNAHRLPLQIGSYLLNEDLAPVWSTQQSFVQQWQFAQYRNQLTAITVQQVIKQFRRKPYLISGRADKFINDLNAEIELGWTGFGQTNRLLGRITMREYIFHHVLVGGEPLQGEALVQRVVEVARSLPGYHDYCRHRHEIEQRAAEWVRCIERSHYFHYGSASGRFKGKQNLAAELQTVVEQAPNWNQEQSLAARERIRQAIADLLTQEALPTTATARFHALVRYGIGGSTLYRHRDLWHPSCFQAETDKLNNCVWGQFPNSAPSTHSATQSAALPDQTVENPPFPQLQI
ncbi:hypothetical protein [Leptodesmis sp.]|uniref:hypothetical protein n=1 Tax=Leptodesmis sp. TaxID=3100501 RepID=UPI00405350B9